mmetsp:Transcript_1630/g.4590  ORF Transcript_1630/g.4590 Transcript_1630/m.4590 type:complete len:334 (+) Transcript_1630:291-1292(+)
MQLDVSCAWRAGAGAARARAFSRGVGSRHPRRRVGLRRRDGPLFHLRPCRGAACHPRPPRRPGQPCQSPHACPCGAPRRPPAPCPACRAWPACREAGSLARPRRRRRLPAEPWCQPSRPGPPSSAWGSGKPGLRARPRHPWSSGSSPCPSPRARPRHQRGRRGGTRSRSGCAAPCRGRPQRQQAAPPGPTSLPAAGGGQLGPPRPPGRWPCLRGSRRASRSPGRPSSCPGSPRPCPAGAEAPTRPQARCRTLQGAEAAASRLAGLLQHRCPWRTGHAAAAATRRARRLRTQSHRGRAGPRAAHQACPPHCRRPPRRRSSSHLPPGPALGELAG